MPHLIVIHKNDLDGGAQILGICEYTKREEFENKVTALCQVMGWHVKNVKYLHCYDNQIINAFDYV